MPDNLDTSVQPGQDSVPPTPPTPPAGGQSTENWEDRFKGQQREFNTLNSKYTAAQTSIQKLTEELNTLKANSTQTLSSYETEKGNLTNQLQALAKEKETLAQERDRLNGELAKTASRNAQRQALIEAEATDILPFFEKGHFSADGKEGDDLKNAIADFRNMVTGISQQKMLGASPVTPVPNPTQNPTGMNLEELADWLMKPENIDSEQYDAFHATYEKLLPKSS